MSHGVVATMIGLPGAGKTSLCEALSQEIGTKKSIVCKFICYDAILNDRSSWDTPDYCWKSDRRAVFENAVSWLRTELSQNEDKSVWLIVDDNMYYRSMRYAYYQLARDLHIGYAQIFMATPFETCVERNAKRPDESQVPFSVIERMQKRLQAPSPDGYPWEKYTITIDGSRSDGFQWSLERIIDTLSIAEAHPAPKLTELDLIEKERRRNETKESVLHQIDLQLRRLVSQFMTDFSPAKTRNKIASYSTVLRDAKQRVFDSVKSGLLDAETILYDPDALRDLLSETVERK